MRGRVLFRVRAGEDPADVPHFGDIVAGASHGLARFDGGKVERVLRRFTPAMRVARVFRAAGSGWDDLEVDCGLSRTYRVDLDPEADLPSLVGELASTDVVEMASPHYLCETPFDGAGHGAPPSGGALHAQRMVGGAEALRREPGDSALIVAVVDSGVDLDHPEFQGRLRPGVDAVNLPQERVSSYVRLAPGGRPRRAEPQDDMGHGSACAAIIGARGKHMPPGMAGAARILPVRVLCGARMEGRTGLTAVGAVPDIDAGLKTAIDLGARVLNLSFGTPEDALGERDPLPHEEIVRYALARGCVLVAASGNDGDDVRYFPAALPGVIAVGAVDREGKPCAFSSRGTHVVVSAPGQGVVSAAVGGGYQVTSGTSFAAPFVTGACALLFAHAARFSRPLPPSQVRGLLMGSARPFARGTRAAGCGAGILDVPAALRALEDRIETADDPDDRYASVAAAM